MKVIRCAMLASLVFLGFTASSCIRTSTMVEVGKDGKGEIISRYYFSPQVKAMVEQMENAAAAGLGGEGGIGIPDFSLVRDLMDPTREDLESDASKFGEGVSYQSHEKGKDEEGWEGYSVVYAFEDIGKVKIDQNSVPAKAKEFVESSGQDLNAKKGGSLTFRLEGDTLTIHSTLAEGSMEGLVDQDQMDQAREMGIKPSQAMQMAAAAMQGMRAGFFLRSRDGIAETTAEHSNGNLIILSDAEVSKVMEDPDFVTFIDKVGENPEVLTRESVKELFGKLEAMTVELSETVTLKFP
jgi:hypothetical protein